MSLKQAVGWLIFALILTGRGWAQDGIAPGNRVIVQDEGTTQGAVRTLNCTGAGITCTVSGATATLNATGGAGGGNGVEVSLNFSRIGAPGFDLTRWTAYDQTPVSASGFNGIAWSPTLRLHVAVGPTGSGFARISVSGKTPRWAAVVVPAQDWRDIVWSPELGLFVAVSFDGTQKAMTSSDGYNWTLQTTPAGQYRSVTWSPSLSLFVAVGSAGGTNRVMTSPDGVVWTGRTATAVEWQKVTWSPQLSLFVAVASTGTNRVMTSPNGTAWTDRSTPTNTWFTVDWLPTASIFVAGGSSTGTGNDLMSSPDGIAWTFRSSGTTTAGDWKALEASPELGSFVALMTTTAPSFTTDVTTSTDGITWRRTLAGQLPPLTNGLVWNPDYGQFIAVGNNFLVNDIYLSVNDGYPVLPNRYRVTVTGQSWVTASSIIVCSPFGTAADGQTVETYEVADFAVTVSNRIAGVGFDLTVLSPNGVSGTFRFHCLGV